ncbi:O-antigen ligase family protein [Candidatus Daviesbacteria bacterium]|nr:O-antigen ligase family protein [Candidatus Daviesbacteria bacterium]
MRDNLSAIIEKLIFGILVAVAALTPLLFTSLTTEFFEIPKIAFLAAAVLILLVLWSFSWVLQGKVIITRTPLDIPLLLLAITVLISTFLSTSTYVSIFGNFPRVHGSAIAWIIYILLYFIAASNIRTVVQGRIIIFALIASVIINSAVAVFSYFGIYLPLSFAKNMVFNPSGSSFSAAAMILLLLPIVYTHIIKPTKILGLPLSLIAAAVFGITLVLVGSLNLIVLGVAVVLLVILLSDKKNLKDKLPFLLAPLIISVLIFALGFIPLAKKNPLQVKREAFNASFKEIQLPIVASWKVAISSFRDRPAFGSGPSTFLFNFTQYKPPGINLTQLWNLRFDTGFNEYLQVLATLGALGFLAFLSAVLMMFKIASKVIKSEDSLTAGLGLSIFTLILILALHTSTPVTWVLGILIIASLIALRKSEGKVEEFTLGIKTQKITQRTGISSASFDNMITGDVLPIILFIPIIILSLVGMWQTYRVVSADVYHRMGLNSISQKGLTVYDHLRKAENLNPLIDLYRTDMAQTNFLIANAIAQAKAPNEASPQGSLTDQDKANIQQFLSQSINEARAGVALSPRSAQNWEILASIYRQITGVAQNALQFSLDGYGRAINLDPYNPLLRLNVGGLYYSIKNYDMAIRFFDDAVNLKPDFANAYYNLSIALRDKGNLKEAEAIGEKVVQLLQTNTENPDYKVAADYLKDLKARIATGSAQNSGITAPAGTQNGALTNPRLPQVPLDQLQNEPNVATPPAVKK